MALEHYSPSQTIDRGYGKLPSSRVRYDASCLDAFGRLRVGEPFGLYDSKQVYSKQDLLWDEDTNGAGASIDYVAAESSTTLAIGTVDGEYAIRQARRNFGYVPGKSQLSLNTGVFDEGKANLVQRIGYFNANNGPFFEINGTALRLVVRTDTSGTPNDDAFVEQANWNLDTLTGLGEYKNPSGKTLDYTKAQIFVIDLQWLGVGSVRFGFDIDGAVIYCHEVKHANVLASVYMATADLPPRYEIRNTGTTASSSSLKQICSSVSSEGGYRISGFQYSKGNGVTLRTSIGTTLLPIIAIRQASTFNSKDNTRIAQWVKSSIYVEDNTYWEIRHVHAPTSTAGGSWVAVQAGDSSVEFNVGITSVTGGDPHNVDDGYTSTGVGGSTGAANPELSYENLHSYVTRNPLADVSDILVIYAAALTGTTSIGAGFTWVEFD